MDHSLSASEVSQEIQDIEDLEEVEITDDDVDRKILEAKQKKSQCPNLFYIYYDIINPYVNWINTYKFRINQDGLVHLNNGPIFPPLGRIYAGFYVGHNDCIVVSRKMYNMILKRSGYIGPFYPNTH
jgi:hypothetical protein